VAITPSDTPWRYSTKAGSAGNSTAQGSPVASLGKYMSTTAWTGGLHSLFALMSAADNAGSVAQYLCVFTTNLHGTLTKTDTRVYCDGDPAGGASFAFGLDPAGPVPIGSSSAQAAEVANINTAPAGVTFSTPTTYAGGLDVGDIPPGYCQGVWVRRTGANTAAVSSPGEEVTMHAKGGTLA